MTGTEECSAKMTAPSPHPTPPSSIWKHGAGRNCLSRGKVWNRTITKGDWGFSQATEQEANQRQRWAVCWCDLSTEYVPLGSSQSPTLSVSGKLLNISSLCLATVFTTQSRVRQSCQLQLHFHPSNGYFFLCLFSKWEDFFPPTFKLIL